VTIADLRSARLARLSAEPLPALDLSIPPWPGTTVRVEGTDVFVRTTRYAGTAGTGGTGEPALYVHGLGGASTNWTDLAALLAGRLAGSALDLPGFGRSGPPARRDYSIRGHARVVIRLLERTPGGPVHLFGNSMGGAIAVVVAAARPDLVRTLTLISPAMPDLRPRRGSDPAMPLLLVPGLSRVVGRRLARLHPQDRALALIDLCFADPTRVPEHRLAEATEEVRRRAGLPWATDALTRSLRGLVASYLAPPSRSVWRLAGRIEAPTLVIWGDRDRLVDVALAPRTASAIPDCRLLVLPGIGHAAQLEDPLTVARAVLGLLEDAAAR
jgi:pimeloyl-ACP methyl ester carboxylesterase